MTPSLKKTVLVGNLLGSGRAETDTEMLSQAFIETADYKALIETFDFNFVVGRRGTGKTALFIKVANHFREHQGIFLHEERPEEYGAMELQAIPCISTTDYRTVRAISAVAWRGHLLFCVLNDLLKYWKIEKYTGHDYLRAYKVYHGKLFGQSGLKRCSEIIKLCAQGVNNPIEVPGAIAAHLELEKLQSAITEALRTINRSVIFLFDGIDEGWIPTKEATGILGGLARAISDFAEKKNEIHAIAFVRDNIFRALAHLDPDFSRHIEGGTLRLRWDESSLLHLVASRLRTRLHLEQTENDIKVWNRFSQNKLENREGFRHCLEYTLFRPRDILVLLNQAYQVATRSGRQQIVIEDIEGTAKQISKERLNDLTKEYDVVFPGLDLFVKTFEGRPPFENIETIVQALDSSIEHQSFEDRKASDFALFGTGRQVFFALYSVGFIGVQDSSSQGFTFCHDGSRSELDTTMDSQITAVHPCYWKALDMKPEGVEIEVITQIYDDYEVRNNPQIQDLRTKELGQLVSKLPSLPTGDPGSKDFEEWVFRAIKILFSGILSNPELHPNKNAIQRRDIVATNMATMGFWKRVHEDYGTRQVLFEVKNYIDLREDDFRQVLSYTTADYGKFAVIVTRSEAEGLGERERGWLQELWNGHKRLMFIINANLLSRCLSKLRNLKRYDYTENALNKRLDTFVRSYLALRAIPKKKRNK